MKKILLIFIFIFIFIPSCQAIEEVALEKEKNYFDYLADIYYGETDDAKSVSPVIRLFANDGLTFDNSYINSVKFHFLYGSNLTYTNTHNASGNLVHDFQIAEPMLSVKFNENKSEFMFDYNILREFPGYDNKFTHRISRLRISHKINDNQTLTFGQGNRLPYIVNGSLSTMGQEMILKSQIGRNLGDSASVGIRNNGEYKYVKYDIGVYDSTRYMKDFGKGFDFSGHIMFMPLADIEDKTGSLKIGSGYNIGDYCASYRLYSVYAGYDYKKFHIKAEYADADGYNGVQFSQDNAEGYYGTISYDIHPKLQLIGRYDFFTPDKAHSGNNTQEYTVGLAYKPFKNMKILLNCVKREVSNGADSNIILFATRFII